MSGRCESSWQGRARLASSRIYDGDLPRAREFRRQCSDTAPPKSCVLEYVEDGDDHYWLVHNMCAVEANAPALFGQSAVRPRLIPALKYQLARLLTLQVNLLQAVGVGAMGFVLAMQIAHGWPT